MGVLQFLPLIPPHQSTSSRTELSRATLAQDLTVAEGHLPAGATGTIVGVYRSGEAYEMEFTAPFHAVVTVRPDDLR